MQYNINVVNTSTEIFTRITVTINYVAMAHFFEAIYHGIFKYLLVVGSKNIELFGLISI